MMIWPHTWALQVRKNRHVKIMKRPTFTNRWTLQWEISVTKAMVYPPNWATLQLPAAGQTTVGLLFIHLPVADLFSSNLSEIFGALSNVQQHYFHQSWRFWIALNINYPLHAEVNNLIVLPLIWLVLIILKLKSTQIQEIGHMITC